ncbi:MAG: ABC transporter ATP-binding protein [Candidatus Fimenecus sp.]
MRYEKPKNIRSTVRHLVRYLHADLFSLGLIFVSVLIVILGILSVIYLIKIITDDFLLPMISGQMEKSMLPIVRTFSYTIIIFVIAAFSTYMLEKMIIKISERVINRIRADMFDSMEDLPISFFDRHRHGELMSRFTNDVDSVRAFLAHGLVLTVLCIGGIVIMLLILIYMSGWLTLILLASAAAMVAVMLTLGERSAVWFKTQQKDLGKANAYIEEMIEGQKIVKLFNREQAVKDEFAVINDGLKESATKANTYSMAMYPIMYNIGNIDYALTAVVGGFMCISGFITIGTISSYLQFTKVFFVPVANLTNIMHATFACLAGAERVFEIIDEPKEFDAGTVTLVNAEIRQGRISETNDHTGMWAWKLSDGCRVEYKRLCGDVVFENVSFSYDGKKTVLKNINLHAAPGQKIAFVGSTGAGKTTITNLLNRFYEIDSGRILYDGINIKNIKKDDLRRSLSMVLQDTHMFTGTIAENIKYGNLCADEKAVQSAARLSNAEDFIEKLDDKYETELHNDAVNLSQGQRQLLSIARAAVADPPVLVLDEATSSIDTRTESQIENGMDRLMQGRTTFVIAHRLSTVRNADKILVMENGEIIESGTHDDLLEKQGRYYALYTGKFEMK